METGMRGDTYARDVADWKHSLARDAQHVIEFVCVVHTERHQRLIIPARHLVRVRESNV
jgi:hypothetical protein